MPQVDVRPAALQALARPGNSLTFTLTWPAGYLVGKTWSASLGGTAVVPVIVGDVMTITISAAVTTALGTGRHTFLLSDTTGDDQVRIAGRVLLTDSATESSDQTVDVTVASVAVAITVASSNPGIPVGGTTGQALVKSSATAFDAAWVDIGTQIELDAEAAARAAADTSQVGRLNAIEANGWVTTARIGDAQVTAAKVAADVATQAELDAAVASEVARANGAYRALGTDVPQADVDGLEPALDEIRNQQATTMPRIVTLFGGQDDEAPTAGGCTLTADTVNFKIGDRGHKMTIASATTGTLRLDPPGDDDPLSLGPIAVLGMWIYLEDATKITSVGIDLHTDAGLTHLWSGTKSTGLVTGWNLVRFRAKDGTITNAEWGTIYRVRVLVTTNAATTATLGQAWAECPEKAQIVFIEDGGYANFFATGYLDLLALGVPVTWAVAPGKLGTGTGADVYMTAANLATVIADEISEVSLHSWDSTATSGMTAAQLRTDAMRAIKYLRRRGAKGTFWRPAWTQNLATNHAALQPHFIAYATPTAGTATIGCFPPIDRWNIPRYTLHGRTEATLTTLFTDLQTTRQSLFCYTHGIDAAGGSNITPTVWAHFLSLVQAGIAAGWLEGVTMSTLFARAGGRFRRGVAGEHLAEFYNDAGVLTTQRLP